MISLFSNSWSKTPAQDIDMDFFLDGIKTGYWDKAVLDVRARKNDKEEQERLKKSAPSVTISGIFSTREDSGLIQHSGYIAIDLDNLDDPDDVKSILSKDKYVFAAFRSIRHQGLCVIFKITPSRHKDAFRGISEYLYDNYNLIVDPTGINVSRLRYVSLDYDIYISDDAVEKFSLYPKDKEPKKVEKIAFVKTDFDEIINQIIGSRINLCENYHEWLRIAFAFADHFGENGRNYFHQVSSLSLKYEPEVCDRQYTACLKHHNSGRVATIATFYYYCRLAGIATYSQRTKTIVNSAYNGKKGGLSAQQVTDNLKKFSDIEGDDVLSIVSTVQENNIFAEDENLIDQVEMYLRQNYQLRRNILTLNIENDGVPLKQIDLNSIFITCKKIFDKLPYDILDRIINSNFLPSYNPLHEFFEKNRNPSSKGHIDHLFSSIVAKDEKQQEYLNHFGKKWLVGAIASAFGTHSPLMLVLSGSKQGSGKTEFFRRLLPKELKQFYGESKLDAGKDDEILMTQKWFLMDDEMGGKSKKESKRLKELTSKDIFSLREPYGRNNVDLKRLAVLCGTTNDNEIINDPTGNRRIIATQVLKINHKIYNAVDKVGLFIEAYNLYKSGFAWELDADDIAYLNIYAEDFRETSMEAELFLEFFAIATDKSVVPVALTVSAIKAEIEGLTHQRLNLFRLGAEIKRLGAMQRHVRETGTTQRIYLLERRSRNSSLGQSLTPGTFKDMQKENSPIERSEIKEVENGFKPISIPEGPSLTPLGLPF